MPNFVSLTAAANLLQEGKIGIIPTDTVYGIVASAHNPVAVRRMFEAKPREQKPGTVIAASVEQLVALGLKERYMKPVAHYWPAPLSVVIPCTYGTLNYLHMGRGSLAVRIPDDTTLREALTISGPLMTSSANAPSEPTATTITEAVSYFGDSVDFYVDGGTVAGRAPSTIVSIEDDEVVVLRQGSLKVK